ncbi:uncharacterized conserved protein [Hahella chejuensis KCTC 2396]|uniref:Uncharacterized conserved protein n=1 Tax=Hahella chejuensis (strain KCTC 2396) TaxID=349521 RepID=Q2SJT1_HAHCH|nr:sulfite exporter TauE/SafE family protein [Hahella chejuensis]ABC29093.1 uncharacterized conserved protein [Hahella chejuensis KCTC 2396]
MHELLLIANAFLIGLFGSGHCIAMCGGIAGAQSFAQGGDGSPRASWLFLFNFGRLSSYALIGLFAGLLGEALALSDTLLVALRTLAAVMIILMGLYVGQWWMGLTHIERLGGRLWSRISPLSKSLGERQGPHISFALGLLWGWLPCGLVYSALAWSMSNADASLSALLMFCFGLGTLPSMLAAGLFAYHLRRWLSNLSVRRVFGALLILFGLWTLPVHFAGLFGGQGMEHQHDASSSTHHSGP